jgi:hypothetical protein
MISGGSSHTRLDCMVLSSRVEVILESMDMLTLEKVPLVYIVVKCDAGDCSFGDTLESYFDCFEDADILFGFDSDVVVRQG